MAKPIIGFFGRSNAREQMCKETMTRVLEHNREDMVLSIFELTQKIGEQKVVKELQELCKKHKV